MRRASSRLAALAVGIALAPACQVGAGRARPLSGADVERGGHTPVRASRLEAGRP